MLLALFSPRLQPSPRQAGMCFQKEKPAAGFGSGCSHVCRACAAGGTGLTSTGAACCEDRDVRFPVTRAGRRSALRGRGSPGGALPSVLPEHKLLGHPRSFPVFSQLLSGRGSGHPLLPFFLHGIEHIFICLFVVSLFSGCHICSHLLSI